MLEGCVDGPLPVLSRHPLPQFFRMAMSALWLHLCQVAIHDESPQPVKVSSSVTQYNKPVLGDDDRLPAYPANSTLYFR